MAAQERMRALLQANSKLEDDLATANENAQAQMMKAASATEQAELAAEAVRYTLVPPSATSCHRVYLTKGASSKESEGGTVRDTMPSAAGCL